MLIKVFILIFSTINAFLAIEAKKWRDHKTRTFFIALFLIGTFILSVWAYNIDNSESEKLLSNHLSERKQDSILSENRHLIQMMKIESISKRKQDSLQYIINNNFVKQNGDANFSNIESRVTAPQIAKYEVKNIAAPKNKTTGNNSPAGDNNTNIYNNEIELTEKAKTDIVNFINSVKMKFNTKTDTIELTITKESNGGKFLSQLEEFLISKGYVVKYGGTRLYHNIERGILFNYKNEVISICIGILKPF